jgi:hypothetical protein
MASIPNVDGPSCLDSPSPRLSAYERPGSRGMLGIARIWYSGILGCDCTFPVASHPMRHPPAASGRSYFALSPQALVRSALCSTRGAAPVLRVLGSQKTSR